MSNALSIPTGSPVTSLPRCLKTSCASSGGCYKVRFENLCKHPLLLKVFETGQSHQTMGLVGETGLKGCGGSLWLGLEKISRLRGTAWFPKNGFVFKYQSGCLSVS